MKNKLVIFCGGRASTSILLELVKTDQFHITAIINALDDGKSSGIIRTLFEMLGPSDIRKLQITLASKSKPEVRAIVELLEYRFVTNSDFLNALIPPFNFLQKYLLRDPVKSYIVNCLNQFTLHINSSKGAINFADFSLGNCIYAGAFLLNNRNLRKTILDIGELLNCKGQVVTVTDSCLFLNALGIDGHIYASEYEIDTSYGAKFLNFFLTTNKLNSDVIELLYPLTLNERYNYLLSISAIPEVSDIAKETIQHADFIIYGPGTPSTSLLPSYRMPELGKIISGNKRAKKIFISNLYSEYKYHWTSPFLELQSMLKCFNATRNSEDFVNFVLVNRSGDSLDSIKKIRNKYKNVSIIDSFFASPSSNHDGAKVANVILDLVS